MSSFVTLLLSLLLSSMALTSDGSKDTKRLPEPPPLAVEEALAELRDAFRDEYAGRRREQRLELARTLLDEATRGKNSPATTFTLLKESRDLATEAADVSLALDAVQALLERFSVDAISFPLQALDRLAKKKSRGAASSRLAREYLKLVDEAVALDRYAEALRSINGASKAARSARDTQLRDRTKSLKKDVEAIRDAFAKAKTALVRLLDDPDIAKDRLVAGRFFAMYKNDWAGGLPHLERGDDEPLAKLAAQDIRSSGNEDVDTQIALRLGDDWWNAASKEKRLPKRRCQRRAAHWYGRALPALSGVTRRRALQRMEQVSDGRLDAILRDAIILLTFDPPTLFEKDGKLWLRDVGKRGHDGEVVGMKTPKPIRGVAGGALVFDGSDDHVLLPKLIDALGKDVHALTLSMWLRSEKKPTISLIFDVGLYADSSVSLVEAGKEWQFSLPISGGQSVKAPLPEGIGWHHVACVWDGKEQRIYVDGAVVDRKPTSALSITARSFGEHVARIGGQAKPGSRNERYFRGAVDEFGLFRRALTDAEITSLLLHGRDGQSLGF